MIAAGMQEIIEKMQDGLDAGEDLVLAVITDASGSTPRGKGAAMLVGSSGLIAGTIGGGAMEADTLNRAAACLAEKRSWQMDFRMDGSASALEAGMICGGTATVLLQFINASQENWHRFAKDALSVMKDGGKAFLRFDLETDTAAVVMDEPAEEAGIFSVPIGPSERALIFGGGHIAAALAPILKSVGFRVAVMDDRPEFADPARFPDAARVVCGDFRYISKFFTLCESDYAVVVTSGHIHDFEVEEQLLRQELAYVGVIGSRKKTAAVNAKLREAGIAEEQIAKVHTPIGLAIGAVTPEEIAVSIAAELIRVRAERRKEL